MTQYAGRGMHRLVAVVVGTAVVAAAMAGGPARADHTATPSRSPDGAGQLEGTELVEDQAFLGHPCFLVTRHVFGLQGAGTFAGRSAAGEAVVYKAELGESQALHQGPLSVEIENAESYHHGPNGTHGGDSSCSLGTAGTPVQASFSVYAAEVATDTDGDSRVDVLEGTAWVYRVDGAGAKVPCTGTGSYVREGQYGDNWHAEWTLDADCTVVGNAAGAPGEGISPAYTQVTHVGHHAPCSAACVDNFRVDYEQYLPVEGLAVNLGGPAGAAVGQPVTVSARVVDGGAPVAGAAVAFSVSGPAPAPAAGSGATGTDGRTSFTFTAGAEGDYVVTAQATTPTAAGQVATATHPVRFVLGDPSLTMAGLGRAQTEGPVRVKALLVDRSNPVPGDPPHDPVPGVEVHFDVTGPGTATPSSGSDLTDWGLAVFEFAADRAGTYTVTATASYLGKDVTATHTVDLDVATLSRVGAVDLPEGELDLGSGVVDPDGRYGYFGTTGTNPGRVVKVDLATLERVAALDLTPYSERSLRAAVIDPDGRYAYFGTFTAPGRVIKVDLDTFQVAGVLVLPDDEKWLNAAVIDPAGRYAYFGTDLGGGVIKVDLATFERVGALVLPAEEVQLTSAAIDPAGAYAYFGTYNPDGARVVKVDLATFQRVGAVSPSNGAQEISSALIDPTGRHGYLVWSGIVQNRQVSGITKVDLQSFEPVGLVDMPDTSVGIDGTFVRGVLPGRGVVDPNGRFAYFGVSLGRDGNYPVVAGFIPVGTDWVNLVHGLPKADGVLKVDLARFELAHVLPLSPGENGLTSVVMAPDGSHLYLGTSPDQGNRFNPADDVPSKVVKVSLTRPPVPWLVAGDDPYATPYRTQLGVAAPGVLGNDTDTEDGDALTAHLQRGPAHGEVTLERDGSFVYTPEGGFSGTDTFTYLASDGMEYSAPATVSVEVGAPEGAEGLAFGYYTDVSLFGGPSEVRGYGQAEDAPAEAASPAVACPPAGGGGSATDADGARAMYGPAAIFGGIWPDESPSAPPSGPLTVGVDCDPGQVTASASVTLMPEGSVWDPPPAGGDTYPHPGGVGPGPFVGDEVHSSCTMTADGLSASTTVINGVLHTQHDPETGQPTQTEPVPQNPPPNYTREGTLDHVGDSYRVVFNEQVDNPDGSFTVNAVHMYLLGPTAVGDMVVGSATCGPSVGETPGTGTVAGSVTDAGSGEPIAGATVTADGRSATTDADGAYVLSDVTAGEHSVTAAADGYDDASQQATVVEGQTATVDFVLTPAAPAGRAPADFDGDGTSDIGVFRPATGGWHIHGQTTTFHGRDGDVAVAGDYDGDGAADVGVFRPATGGWYVQGQSPVFHGRDGDLAVPGDYDGDATTDIGVFRPSNGGWYLAGQSPVFHGREGDIPVPGDYDGDGGLELAVFRPATGGWYVAGQSPVFHGRDGDVPVPGDYDGDGATDIGVFRPSTGGWYIAGQSPVFHGRDGDVPVPGDYDGDGTADIGVFRPSTGGWYIQGQAAVFHGRDGDVPLPLSPAIHQAAYPPTG